MQMLNFNNFL